MKVYAKPIVRKIEFETTDLMAGSVDETGVSEGYHHAKSSSDDEWED